MTTPLENFDIALASLESAALALSKESEEHYDAGDNHRGNVCHDAAHGLRMELDRIRLNREHLSVVFNRLDCGKGKRGGAAEAI